MPVNLQKGDSHAPGVLTLQQLTTFELQVRTPECPVGAELTSN